MEFSPERQQIVDLFEKLGTAWASSFIEAKDVSSAQQNWVREWLFTKREQERAARDEEQQTATFKSLEATQHAAQVSQQSAGASRRSAFWTMIAAIFAALGTIFTVLHTLGWLGSAK
jgi:ferric-dicitrate binding protein FerR (iron transport regulator)